MRLSTLTAFSALAFAAAAVPAQAQTDGEQIFRSVLQGLLGPQPGATQQQQQQAAAQAQARFDVSDLTGRDTCDLILSGAGDRGAVEPQAGCPGVLGTARQWQRVEGDLMLMNAQGTAIWRGQPNPRGEGWTGGVADTFRVYTIAPGAAVGPGNAPSSPSFDAATLHGDWRAAEPGQTRGCRVTFVKPDPNNRYAVQNAVRTERGCPAYVGEVTNWYESNGTLTLTDSSGNVMATLTRSSADRWTGASDEVPVIFTRL